MKFTLGTKGKLPGASAGLPVDLKFDSTLGINISASLHFEMNRVTRDSRTWSIATNVRVPPNSYMSAYALGWQSSAVMRWTSPNPVATLQNGKDVKMDAVGGEVRVKGGQHFQVQYRCWIVKDGNELPCPTYYDVVKVVSGDVSENETTPA